MRRAVRICARLLRAGALPLTEVPGLELPEVQREVESRLQGVGLVLATSSYSGHVGIRLAPEVARDPAFEAASNLGLGPDACALLVVLWVRLVLPRRPTQVRLDTLARELRSLLGDRRHIRELVGQLRRLSFLTGSGEIIEAGPLLELGLDGDRMIAFLRGGVLAGLLEERAESLAVAASQVVEVLKRLGGSAAMTDLVREIGAPASRLRSVLRSLAAEGRVRRTGERRSSRYHLTRV
ncbi:MAG TPA: hypothetical protein VFR31_11320 [Thermoanaerobaculia bacterium]|nr:hypothetical protein [Thermoanaerobaculia bacterium]